MKFRKFTPTLFIAIVLLMLACKKDSKPTPDTPEESGPAKEGLFTGATYYFKLSDSATAAPWHRDSVYYNKKYQISKVVDYLEANKSVVYSFTYNTDATVAALKVRGTDFKQDYLFYYRDKRIDSFLIYDSTAANQPPLKLTTKAAYNAQSKLIRLVNSQSQGTVTEDVYNTSYYRNTAGRLDSIKVNFAYDGSSGFRSMHLSASVSPVNKMLSSLDPAYKILMAVRQDQFLNSFGSNNLYLHDILSPGDNVFNDGIFKKPNDPAGKTYKSACLMNVNNTVKTYQYFEGSTDGVEEKYGVKLEYYTGR